MSDQIGQVLAEPKRLEALARTQLVNTPAEETYDRLTRLASRLLKAPVALVSLVEPERQFFKSQTGLQEPWASRRETPISHSFCKHVVASGEPLIIVDARENPLVCDNPAIRDLNVIAYLGVPLTSPDGWHLGSFCVIDSQPRVWTNQDLETVLTLAEFVGTEIELRLEVKAKDEAIAELEARNAELDAFAHTVSHNLKNPISAIIGWVSVSTSYAERMSSQELLDAIGTIGDLAAHSDDIINALLLLARVSRSGETPRQTLNMFDIVEDALSRLEAEIRARGVVISLPAANTFPRCIGYRPWIEEVWVNYISNAIKYGGNPAKIELGAERLPDNFVRYWIEDNGEGISLDEQRTLFIPFSRLPQTAAVEGHGLGLSIVQTIISKLGGEVGVTSTIGEGSTFSFTLPTESTNTD